MHIAHFLLNIITLFFWHWAAALAEINEGHQRYIYTEDKKNSVYSSKPENTNIMLLTKCFSAVKLLFLFVDKTFARTVRFTCEYLKRSKKKGNQEI